MNSMLRSVVSLYSAVLLTSVAVNADTLTLLDQRILHGTFVGASAQTIHFQVNGRIREFAAPNVLSLAFNQETALDTSRVKPAPGNDRGVIIGTDADLMVHLPGRIPTNIGSSFKAVLAEDLRAGKVLVAPAGSEVLGHLVNGDAAPGTLKLVLTTIRVRGKLLPIKTEVHRLMVQNQEPTGTAMSSTVELQNTPVAFRLRQPISIRLASY